MNKQKFENVISDNINSYKQKVLEVLNSNPILNEIVSKICFGDNSNQLNDYIKKLNVDGFNIKNYISNHELKFNGLKFSDIDKIKYNFNFINPELYDKYFIFKKEEFESYQDLVNAFDGFFFRNHKNFVNKIDSLILTRIEGFKRVKGSLFQKKITEDINLIIDARKSQRPSMQTIEDYAFPLIYLFYKNQRYYFNENNSFDALSFLFVNSIHSYLVFFYRNRKIAKEKEEPIVYKDELTGKYILTNSLENLERFNKYIFIISELYLHFFKIFDEWVFENISTMEQENQIVTK